ncbi:MAG: hypothetical protein ABJA84_00790 [Polaromonas sp.]
MNLDIAHLRVTLQDVSPDLGGRVTELLGHALQRQLSGLKPNGGGIARDMARDIAHADLGFIEAPAGADAQALSELIAAQLVDWIDKEGH